MDKIINIYKPIGLTPYQLIQKLRFTKKEFQQIKIGFAGRLDPLAHGVMILMIGVETKNRDKYLGLPKEYEFEVMFGVSTDTYDALGIIQSCHPEFVWGSIKINQIKNFIKTKMGKQIQQYPPYSSKEINGKPLHQWARENRLSEIKIPEREIEIYKFKLLNIKKITVEEIKNKIAENFKNVDGDFRQSEILKKWDALFTGNKVEHFTIAKFKVNCSSGTYVRSLANEMGEFLDTGAIALSILRTKVGKYNLENSIRIG